MIINRRMHPTGKFSLSLSEPNTRKPTFKIGLYCLHDLTVYLVYIISRGARSGMIREPLEPQSSTLPIELRTPYKLKSFNFVGQVGFEPTQPKGNRFHGRQLPSTILFPCHF